MSIWIRVRDGWVNSNHVVKIMEDDCYGNSSIMHLVDGSTAIADIQACNLVKQIDRLLPELPQPSSDIDDDDSIPF